MMELFKPEHLENFKFNQDTIDFFEGDTGQSIKIISLLLSTMETYTISKKGVVLCICAGWMYYKDCWKLMILPSNDFADNKLYLCAGLKEIIQNGLKDGAIRIETESIDTPLNDRWHKWLGFKKEGLKRKFINGKDYTMWAILKEEQD